ncbi:perlucin-like [Watersipora subatra]|uniref:perlucin-like n=1 Tax=Watersipora subatra TaxID=2589382 RepID=UPI00355C611F
MDGYLATLESEEEIIWMHGYRSYHKTLRATSYWLGGQKSSGIWSWVRPDGTYPIKVFDWAAGQPDNNAGNQNCLSMFGERQDMNIGGVWFRFDDDTCTTFNNYVCEKTM